MDLLTQRFFFQIVHHMQWQPVQFYSHPISSIHELDLWFVGKRTQNISIKKKSLSTSENRDLGAEVVHKVTKKIDWILTCFPYYIAYLHCVTMVLQHKWDLAHTAIWEIAEIKSHKVLVGWNALSGENQIENRFYVSEYRQKMSKK